MLFKSEMSGRDTFHRYAHLIRARNAGRMAAITVKGVMENLDQSSSQKLIDRKKIAEAGDDRCSSVAGGPVTPDAFML